MNAETTTKQLPIDKLHESPFNRRRAWGNLDELAASIQKVGLLEELLARPHPSRKGEFELVFGHRRLRAAKLAGVAAVPSKVRPMSDDAVLDAQIIENLQREDVHPLDEAETYEQHIAGGKTATEIAARVGKHPSYVHQRLRLLTLCEDVRAAYAADRISTAVAILIARLPSHTAQIEALEDVGGTQYRPAATLAEARQVIESSFLLRLADAPFDRSECARCPSRTGNQPELFGDVANADTCTDRGCFEAKTKAHHEGLLENAKTRGLPVLTGRVAVNAISDAGWSRTSEYIDLDREVRGVGDEELFDDDDGEDAGFDDEKPRPEPPPRKTYRELLAGAALDVTIAQDSAGKVHELVPRALVAAVLPSEAPKGGRVHPTVDFAKEQREKAAKQRAKTLALIGAIVDQAGAKGDAESGFWHFLGHLLIEHAHHDTRSEVCKRRRLEVPEVKRLYGSGKSYDYEKALGTALDSANAGAQKALCVELLVSRTAFFGEGLTKQLKAAVSYYEIDTKKVYADAKKSAAKKPAKKAAKAAAPAKKAANKKGERRG